MTGVFQRTRSFRGEKEPKDDSPLWCWCSRIMKYQKNVTGLKKKISKQRETCDCNLAVKSILDGSDVSFKRTWDLLLEEKMGKKTIYYIYIFMLTRKAPTAEGSFQGSAITIWPCREQRLQQGIEQRDCGSRHSSPITY